MKPQSKFGRSIKTPFGRLGSGAFLEEGGDLPGSAPAGSKSAPSSSVTPEEIMELKRLGLFKGQGYDTQHYGDTKSLWGDNYKGYDYIDVDPNVNIDTYPKSLRNIMSTEPAFPNMPGRIVMNRYYNEPAAPGPKRPVVYPDAKYQYSTYKNTSSPQPALATRKMGGKMTKWSKPC